MNAGAIIVTPLSQIAAVERASTGRSPSAETIQLTSAMAGGDEDAFREFHGAYKDRLLRYLFVLSRGDETLALDALQETFVRVARHVRKFESEEKFWSWLTVLARTAAADLARRRSSYWRMLARLADWFSPATHVIDSAEADQTLEALLRQAVADLSEEERELIDGKYVRGASMKELAAELNMSERAVESRLGRIRQRLREAVASSLKHGN